MLAVVVVALVGAPAAVHAGPRAPGLTARFGFAGGVAAYTSDCAGCDTGPSLGLTLRGGWAFGHDARVAFGLEGGGFESWHDAGRRVHGAAGVFAALWPSDRLSLGLSIGSTVSEATSAEGTEETVLGAGVAAEGSVGYELVRWSSATLVLRAGVGLGGYDDGDLAHLSLGLVVDSFAIAGS